MKKVTLLLIGATIVLGGQAFTQQTDSTSDIVFETRKGTGVPVFEVMGQSSGIVSGGESGFITTQDTALRPAFMAPTTVTVPNGWHRYQIGESALFSRKFDVVADGSTQRWLLSGGSPALNILGWVTYSVGFGVGLWYGMDLIDTTYLTDDERSTSLVMTIGGVVAFVGGLVLVFTTLPRATRVQ